MPKESFNPTSEEQASIDEHMGHEQGFLRKQSKESEELWEKMDEEQREALTYSSLRFNKESTTINRARGEVGITGKIKGHEIFLYKLIEGDDWSFSGSLDGKTISPVEAKRLFEKYYLITRFQWVRNQQPDSAGDAIAATL